MFLKFLFTLLACGHAQGTDLTADLRYRVSSSTKDTVGTTLIADFPIAEPLNFRTGLRIYSAFIQPRSLHYFGELDYPLLPFFMLRTRVNHGYRFQEPTSTTNATISGDLGGTIFNLISAHFEMGWYERFSRIDGGLPFPIFFANPRREHDFILALRLGARIYSSFWLRAEIATFEEIEVDNFNNPFGQVKGEFELEEVGKVSIFVRAKLLGGFGRLDELVTGVALTMPFRPVEEGD